MPPRKSHTKAKANDDGVPTPKTKRAPKIQWAKNPDWTFTLIEYLGDNVGFRLALFTFYNRCSQRKPAQTDSQREQESAVYHSGQAYLFD
jgi:hypothetical protein